MRILGLNAGHDGAFTAVEDGRLLFCEEAEKNSFRRHRALTSTSVINAVQHLDGVPDVIAHGGGWGEGAGYHGANGSLRRETSVLGRPGTLVLTTHERAHILSSIALAPRHEPTVRAALVWEGLLGKLYLVDERCYITTEVEVLDMPGSRWALLFALADAEFPDAGAVPRDTDAGKLMALAAYGDADDPGPAATKIVDRILTLPMKDVWPASKWRFRDTPVYNAGVEAEVTKAAAALLSRRIFDTYANAAREHLPPGLPLFVSGGCGLNCDWNRMWQDLGHFSSVFVPPCPNDAGLAIGAAADAQLVLTADPFIEWSVYTGLEFDWDHDPDPAIWRKRPADDGAIAAALADGRVFAWVQGRAELGPRALGNRSLLADPSSASARDQLNQIKQREGYRPIAPVCRVEDLADTFDTGFEDPYMLYFRMVLTDRLPAVTHVDGTARCQTVSEETNPRLHDLLCAVAARTGIGALCNTSLNRRGLGFLNRTSDLERYCLRRLVDDMVINDAWFERLEPLRHEARAVLLRNQGQLPARNLYTGPSRDVAYTRPRASSPNELSDATRRLRLRSSVASPPWTRRVRSRPMQKSPYT